ncbi:type III secretion protein HrpV [Ralstonia pseudosolanacearum]|uniref:type III secretion protein HrpV n=1 Tax=Ralstonia pseudosolanacearum TaxID=1310165 RepID=UPI000B92E1DF|nr:type III secretion protein HrpV [Ralstonia pseudosolanacearum]
MTRITGPSSAIYTLPDPATTPAQPAAATPNTHRRRPRQLHEREIEHEHELQYQEQLTGRRKHLAKLAKRIRRPGLKRRNAANAADEPTTDSDFEELLMIMEEHARLSKPLLVGPSKQGNPHDGQQGRRGNNPQSDLAGRHSMLRRYLLEAEAAEAAKAEEKAPAQASSAPGKGAGGAAPVLPAQRKELAAQLTGTAEIPTYKMLLAELCALLYAVRAGHSMPLRLALNLSRAFIKASPLAGAPETLHAVKKDLVASVPPAEHKARSEREETFHLLLPLMLLSASLPRTSTMKSEGYARSGALARRWEAEVWSHQAGVAGMTVRPINVSA